VSGAALSDDRIGFDTEVTGEEQDLMGLADNQNSTIILPVPIDLIRPFMQPTNGADGTHHATRREEENEAERLYEEAVGDISPETTPAEDQTPSETSPRPEPT
jgi:hypothetical protein